MFEIVIEYYTIRALGRCEMRHVLAKTDRFMRQFETQFFAQKCPICRHGSFGIRNFQIFQIFNSVFELAGRCFIEYMRHETMILCDLSSVVISGNGASLRREAKER